MGDSGVALDRVLTWIGDRSWGIYLSHLLVFNGLLYLDIDPQIFATPIRFIYFSALLAGGVAGVLLGSAMTREIARS